MIMKLHRAKNESETLRFSKTMPSLVGELTLVASDKGLSAILWENDDPGRVRTGPLQEDKSHPVLREAERQLQDYFAGTLERFTVPLDFNIGTDFQKKVWKALTTIPFGETRSYAQIAAAIGQPKAVRAVGTANGDNHVAVLIPCHRVIRSDGTLGGYAGGLDRKRKLLAAEGLREASPELPLA